MSQAESFKGKMGLSSRGKAAPCRNLPPQEAETRRVLELEIAYAVTITMPGAVTTRSSLVDGLNRHFNADGAVTTLRDRDKNLSRLDYVAFDFHQVTISNFFGAFDRAEITRA